MAITLSIIGCGLIGKKRAAEIAKDPSSRLLYAIDVDETQTRFLQDQYGCAGSSDWRLAVESPEIDAIILSTPNHLSKRIAIAALQAGKDVLIEKPFGKNFSESTEILQAAKQSNRFLVVKTGFNHRYHPALSQAKKIVEEQTIGKLFSIRARYGHGGRKGMEKEWRSSKELCGGGELLDQGIHIIDLVQWFAGDWKEVYGSLATQFLPIPVEDNAYVIGKTVQEVSVLFHVSWTQWKNLFSFELFGDKGSIHVQGLGGSYGPETLELCVKKPDGGKPDVTNFVYGQEDVSWQLEWQDFKKALLERKTPSASGEDGWKANKVIAAIEKSNLEKIRVLIE